MPETIFCPVCMLEIPRESTRCPECGQAITAKKPTWDQAGQWVRDRAEEYSLAGMETEKEILRDILSAHPNGMTHTCPPSLVTEDYENLLAMFRGLMDSRDWLVGLTTKRLILVHVADHDARVIPLDKIKRVEHTVDGQFARLILSRKSDAKTINGMASETASKIAALIGEQIAVTNDDASSERRVSKRPARTISSPAPLVSSLAGEGDPTHSRFHGQARQTRSCAEMIGLCKGVIADGLVCEDEARFLLNWFMANPEAASCWPGGQLGARLAEIWRDNKVTPEELADLKELIAELTGLTNSGAMAVPANLSSSLPFDLPEPTVEFAGKSFCFTGKMVYGPRAFCETQVCERGGSAAGRVTMSLNYLVIGFLGSPDWKQSSHGGKILQAMDYKEKGAPIKIISEDSWVNAL